MGISYCCVQQSDEKIRLIMAHVGITSTTADDSSEDNEVMDTEELLHDLSDAQRNLTEENQKKTTKGKGKGKGKAIAGKIFIQGERDQV